MRFTRFENGFQAVLFGQTFLTVHDAGFYFRICGYGFNVINRHKQQPLFSVRNGYKKEKRFGKYGVQALSPEQKLTNQEIESRLMSGFLAGFFLGLFVGVVSGVVWLPALVGAIGGMFINLKTGWIK